MIKEYRLQMYRSYLLQNLLHKPLEVPILVYKYHIVCLGTNLLDYSSLFSQKLLLNCPVLEVFRTDFCL